MAARKPSGFIVGLIFLLLVMIGCAISIGCSNRVAVVEPASPVTVDDGPSDSVVTYTLFAYTNSAGVLTSDPGYTSKARCLAAVQDLQGQLDRVILTACVQHR
jgi:hypothetical protein